METEAEKESREKLQGKPLPDLAPRPIMKLVMAAVHNNGYTEDKTLALVDELERAQKLELQNAGRIVGKEGEEKRAKLIEANKNQWLEFFSYANTDGNLPKTALAIKEKNLVTLKDPSEAEKVEEEKIAEAVRRAKEDRLFRKVLGEEVHGTAQREVPVERVPEGQLVFR